MHAVQALRAGVPVARLARVLGIAHHLAAGQLLGALEEGLVGELEGEERAQRPLQRQRPGQDLERPGHVVQVDQVAAEQHGREPGERGRQGGKGQQHAVAAGHPPPRPVGAHQNCM